MPPYRQSSQPYMMSTGSEADYPQKMVPQIIAHYKIQLQLQVQKLKDMEKGYKLKFEEMQRRIVEAQRQKKYKNFDKVQDQSLQRQVQNKKKEIEYLTRKLQNLRKMPLNILNSIDELLIPHESPYTLINAKKKEIKLLQNQLAQSQNIFQGKYMIQHKLINQYETQLVLNKKLKLLKEQKQVIKQKSLQISRLKAKNTMINADYKKKSQQLFQQIQTLKSKIHHFQTQTFNQQPFSYPNLTAIDQKPISKIYNKNYASLQSLELEKLQFQLQQMITQNQELVIRRTQKDIELKKIIQRNEKMVEQSTIISKFMDLRFAQNQEQIQSTNKGTFYEEDLKKQDFYRRTKRKIGEFNQQPETSKGKINHEKESKIEQKELEKEESLLQSVIKFFSRRTQASEQKQEKEKYKPISLEQNKNTPRYSMAQLQNQDSRFTHTLTQWRSGQNQFDESQNKDNKIISNSEELRQIFRKQESEDRQKVHEKYLSKIQNQSLIKDDKKVKKYDKFELGNIYKKQVKTSNTNNEQQHVKFDLN